MDYPTGFPHHLEPPVDAALHEAEEEFLKAKKSSSADRDAERLIRPYIYNVFLAFAFQACRAIEEGTWNHEKVRRVLDDWLGKLIHYVYYDKVTDVSDFVFSAFR